MLFVFDERDWLELDYESAMREIEVLSCTVDVGWLEYIVST